jgi:Ca2+-binding RTX toxin-like protein
MCILCSMVGTGLLGEGSDYTRGSFFQRMMDESGLLQSGDLSDAAGGGRAPDAAAMFGLGTPGVSGNFGGGVDVLGSMILDATSVRWNADLPLGSPVVLTYSFMSSVPSYDVPSDRPGFRGFDATQQASTRRALEDWAKVTGITFVEVAEGLGHLRFGMHDFTSSAWIGASGYAYFPSGSTTAPYGVAGDTWVSATEFWNNPMSFGWGYQVLLHEIGHAIGLKHPFDGSTTLPDLFNSVLNTVMAYRGGSTNVLGPYDLEAARYLYGTADLAASWNPATYQLTRVGTEATDRVVGIELADVILGRGGADFIDAGPGADVVYGGAGGDTLLGDAGVDFLFGDGEAWETGSDTIAGEEGGDIVYAGAGDDLVFGGFREGWTETDGDVVFGGDGNDTVAGAGGRDIVYGDGGDDVLFGGYFGGLSGSGDDVLFGGAGADTAIGDDGVDWLLGEAGADRLDAGAGADWVTGGDGDDTVFGGADADLLFGDAGADTVDGGDGDDAVWGGAGNDVIRTGAGSDLILIAASDVVAGGSEIVLDFSMGNDHLGIAGVDLSTIQWGNYAGGAYGVVPVAGGTFTIVAVAINGSQLQSAVFAWTG